ncbi:MAG: class I SAM-dependent methyltransferase [Planctomycetes bacterium]|nr:class I SAM-dependent methyltransferase [Planctomycetota bacterium]
MRQSEMHFARRRRSSLGLLLCAAVIGVTIPACQTAKPIPRSERTGELSVRPGVNDKYRENDFDSWLDRFEVESREIYTERNRLVDDVGIRPGMVVADIGSGTGFYVMLFAKKASPGGKVIAVDIIPEFLERIRQRADAEKLTNVETSLCDEDTIYLPPASIDLAFICDTYHHFEYPMSTMTSLYVAMKPGGEVVLVDFIRDPESSDAWVLGHVRAGQEVVIKEVESAGFQLVDKGGHIDYLKKNYVLRFRKAGETG